MTDPYTTLGVTPIHTDEEIKVAYRRLAQKHHPDRGGDDELFRAIQEAYELIGDPESRAEYDRTGKSKKQNETEHKVNTTLIDLFVAVVSDEHFRGNYVTTMKRMVADKLREASHTIGVGKKEQVRLTRILNRVNSVTFTDVVQDRLTKLTEQVTRIEGEMDVLNLVLVELEQLADLSPDEMTQYIDSRNIVFTNSTSI